MKTVVATLLMLLTFVAVAAANEITPEAEKLLADMSAANAKLNSISLEGKLTGDFDVAGMKNSYNKEFQSKWISAGQFRVNVPDEIVIGTTGERLYQFEPKNKMYVQVDSKSAGRALPEQVLEMLIAQDLQLLLAGHADTTELLKKTFTTIKTGSEEAIGETKYRTLVLEDDGRVMTALVDPSTQLVKQVRTDPTKALQKRGATDIKKAQLTLEYTKVEPNAQLKAEEFAWQPPEGARDMAESVGGGAAKELEGKPAPAFSLKTLDGKDVSLAELKGKVVVLDFWATWCGPCVVSLPGLDKVWQDRAKQNVVIYAVNEEEEKEIVQSFVEKTKLSVPVLMDTAGNVGRDYKAETIPLTIVIGKDGVVRKTISGISLAEGHKPLEEAIDAELKK